MISQHTEAVRIGTSGIVVPGNRESFPAAYQLKSRLNYYSSLFNTVEVNSTFKKIPKPSTFEKWSLDVPETFRFTIKLWNEITHVKQLDTDLNNIDLFCKAADHIGNKKGCLLIQFPGSITAPYSSHVEQILRRLQQLDHEKQWSKAVEFRSVSWYNNETYHLLDTYNASMVLHDIPKSKNLEMQKSSKFMYLRLHGPKGDYRGSYSAEFLEERAKHIRHVLNEGKEVYVYFNNTMGNAFGNAILLKEMINR